MTPADRVLARHQVPARTLPRAAPDPRLAGLLRWYPRAWRERYGEEFLALVEDTLDGRRPGWRLRLGVAWAGLRERGRRAVRAGAGSAVLPVGPARHGRLRPGRVT